MKEKPRLPELNEFVRMHGTLVEIEDVTPEPVERQVDYIFEETVARVEGRINGKVVKDFGTFNDFYGKGTCVDSAIREARGKQQFYGDSDMEFVVVKITSQARMRPKFDGTNHYNTEVFEFEQLTSGSKWDVAEDEEEVVWSSKEDRSED